MKETAMITTEEKQNIVDTLSKIKFIDMLSKINDAETVDRLMRFYLMLIEEENKTEALQALLKVQEEILPIIKEFTAGTDHHKYKYANLASYLEVLKEPLRKYGFILTSTCENERDGMLHLKTRLIHTNGHTITASGYYPIDNISPSGKKNKTDIQGYGSTLSYGIRYNLIQLFTLPAEDNDGAKSRNILIQEVKELAEQADVPISVLLSKANCASLEYMSHDHLQRSINYLQATLEKKVKS